MSAMNNMMAQIMARERATWAVPSEKNGIGPIRPIRQIGLAGQIETNGAIMSINENAIKTEPDQVIEDKPRSSAMAGYWARMTPVQRSDEIKRRIAARAAKQPTSAREPRRIVIPQQHGVMLFVVGNTIRLTQDDNMIELYPAEAKLVAGAILNLVGKMQEE